MLDRGVEQSVISDADWHIGGCGTKAGGAWGQEEEKKWSVICLKQRVEPEVMNPASAQIKSVLCTVYIFMWNLFALCFGGFSP